MKGRDFLPFVFAVLCLIVYLPGINWGIPYATGPERTHAWGNDDLVPLAPLAEMHNTFVEAKPDRNIAYPWFHYFLLACAYSPYLVYLYLTGGIQNPTSIYPFGLSDPVTTFVYLSWIGRSVSLLLAIVTVIGAYLTGKYLWGRREGTITALFTLLMFPMAYYARLGNLDVPVLGWTSLGLATFALMLRQGVTLKRGILFSIFLALAISTKTQAFASFLFIVPFLFWLHFKEGQKHQFGRWQGVWVTPTVAAVVFIAVFVFANGILFDPDRFVEYTRKVFLVGTQVLYLRYPATLNGYLLQARDLVLYLSDVMSWPLLIVAGLGILLAVRRDRLALAMVLSSIGFYLMLLPVRFSRLHYLLAVALPLNLFAAYAFSRALEQRRAIRAGAMVALVGLTGYLLLQTADLTHAMVYDARYAAGKWLRESVEPGDRVMYFGAPLKLPPLRADVEAVRVDYRREVVPAVNEVKPEFIIVMPEDTNEERLRVEWRWGPHSVYNDYITNADYTRLVDGSLGYRLVARFQTPRLFPWLYRPFLSYPTVNPPIHIYARSDRAHDAQTIEPWRTAPHYPEHVSVRELTVDLLRELEQEGKSISAYKPVREEDVYSGK